MEINWRNCAYIIIGIVLVIILPAYYISAKFLVSVPNGPEYNQTILRSPKEVDECTRMVNRKNEIIVLIDKPNGFMFNEINAEPSIRGYLYRHGLPEAADKLNITKITFCFRIYSEKSIDRQQILKDTYDLLLPVSVIGPSGRLIPKNAQLERRENKVKITLDCSKNPLGPYTTGIYPVKKAFFEWLKKHYNHNSVFAKCVHAEIVFAK